MISTVNIKQLKNIFVRYQYLSWLMMIVIILDVRTPRATTHDNNQEYYKQFHTVFEKVLKEYVQVPDKQKMTDAAISGMLSSLDPHSAYYTDEEFEDFINHTKGEFGGIGVEVIYDNNAVKVISPIDGLAADKAGIKSGDYIVGVNSFLVSTIGFNKAVKEMRGDPGTKVKLLVIGENEVKPKEIELVRELVKITPVKAHMEPSSIAYVRIIAFNEHTYTELKKAMKNLQSASQKIKGIILDLRNNPGGLLPQAVLVSEYFVESGPIVSTKGRTQSDNTVLSASRFTLKAPDVPIVVLINGGSASASEIVAGALQDYKRAVIVGTKSFGKASVQTLSEVSPRAAMKLTTARYYTPNGRSIQAEGVEPDIIITQEEVNFSAKSEDKRFSEASLRNYLKNDDLSAKTTEDLKADASKAKSKNEEPKGEKDPKTVTLEKTNTDPSELYKKDYQFARAYDLIRGLILILERDKKL